MKRKKRDEEGMIDIKVSSRRENEEKKPNAVESGIHINELRCNTYHKEYEDRYSD